MGELRAMDEYEIEWVPDEKMGGRDFVLCSKQRDGVVLYMNRRVRDMTDEENANVWKAAWHAYRELAQVEEIPPQRVYAGR